MDAWHELEIRTRIEMLISQREGMVAENQARLQLGQQVAYQEDSFQQIAREFEMLNNSIREVG